MKQQTFSDVEYSIRRNKTKWDEFLEIMNEITPWEEWVAYREPYYFNGKRGRPPMRIEKRLRMYLLQVWFNLSDEGVEEAYMTVTPCASLWGSILWPSRFRTQSHCCISGV